MNRNYLSTILTALLLVTGIATAHAGKDRPALDAAITCFNEATAATKHIRELDGSPRYFPDRRWNTGACDLALLVSKKSGSKALTLALSSFATALTALAVDVDSLIATKNDPAALSAGKAKMFATLDVYAAARAALDRQISKEATEVDRKRLIALAKKEKKKKVKSTSFYQLTLNVAEADLLAALEAKDHDAFNKQLPTIQDAVAALATGPDAEFLADYCAVVLLMHKAASAITPAWGDAEVKAFRAAQQAVVAAFNAL